MKERSCVIFCRCSAGVVSNETADKIAEGLKRFDTDVFELEDLCAFSVNEKDVLRTIGRKFQNKIIVACYPRAVKHMLQQGGIEFGDFNVLNFRELTPEEIFIRLDSQFQIPEGEARYREQVTDLNVPAWFPVIDDTRCNFCGKCARFCLFGVYSYDKKSLKVVDPLACKDNCPACGRTCPTQAIMFPRLPENTVLAGAEPSEKKVSIDKGSLLTTLNQRNQNRKNIFRQGVIAQAEEERRKALEEFKMGMDFKSNDKKDS